MSEKSKKICLGCMHLIDSGVVKCSHCGFDPNTYHPNPRCMRLGARLAGKYVVGKVIGEGGFGITYIGWDLTLKMPVAIKEYFPTKLASRDTTSGNNTIYMFDSANEKSFEDGMRRSQKEAKSLSKLDDFSAIVSIMDFFLENKTAYIIMEYVDGKTLKEYMQEKRMPPKDVLAVMKPVMSALEQMHHVGMIHRDISPDNIMIQKDGQVKLIDFGAARAPQEEGDKSLTILLKRGFTPEEQYRSRGRQGPWTDIYALCATMYFMLTGTIPPEAMDRILEDTYIPLASSKINLDPSILKAIDKGLSVRAQDRFQTMGELIHSIYGDSRKILAIPEGAMEKEKDAPKELSGKVPGKVSKKITGKIAGKKVIAAALVLVLFVVGAGVLIVNLTGSSDDGERTVMAETTEGGEQTGADGRQEAGQSGMDPGRTESEAGQGGADLAQAAGQGGVDPAQAAGQGGVDPAQEAGQGGIAPAQAEEQGGVNPTQETGEGEIDPAQAAGQGGINPAQAEGQGGVNPTQEAGQGGIDPAQVEEQGETVPSAPAASMPPPTAKPTPKPTPKRIQVPDVKGMTKTAAVKKMKKASLDCDVRHQYHSYINYGRVISQTIKPGKMVKRGANVTLTVSRGAKPTPKPNPTKAPTPHSIGSSSGKSSSQSSVTKPKPKPKPKSKSKPKKNNKSSSDLDIVSSGDDFVALN